ncbi:radical SAM protein [Nanoarchaeota archaeon]
MKFAILDCYTDEPSGLGVPPYIGTYPRYIAGAILENNDEVYYFTIDDFRLHFGYKNEIKKSPKTNIKIANTTKNCRHITKILKDINALIVISGVQTPGKYLSALPGTVKEVEQLTKDIKCMKILTGPAASAGEGLYGGKQARINFDYFNKVIPNLEYKFERVCENNFTSDIKADLNYPAIRKPAITGAQIVKQHPNFPDVIAEIETAKGCSREVPCSFCTEPIKNIFTKRDTKDIIEEVTALNKQGIKHFRLGKQSDFFDRDVDEIETILKTIRDKCKIKTLHIDNIDPVSVTEEKVKLITKYCTEGNVAALGIESFDSEVIKQNYLHSTPEISLEAIRIINKLGSEKGPNGLPKFLPGINLLFGLKGESKLTHEYNMEYFYKYR